MQRDQALETLAYEAGLRALSNQQAEMSQLRSAVGILIAASSISASSLGTQTLSRGALGPFSALAILAFAATLVAAIYVLLPNRDFVFALSGPVLYTRLYEFRHDSAELQRQLTYWLETFRLGNQSLLDRSIRWALASGVLLILETVLWALALATKLR